MLVKLIVFDIAGTTVKDHGHNVSNALSNALLQYGYQVPVTEIDPIMGYEKTLAITQLLQAHETGTAKITTDLIHKIHASFVEQMIKHYGTDPDVGPLPTVEETLAELRRQGIKVGINTGFSKDIAETIINRLQWQEKGLIDYLVGSDEVEQGRPYPFMIQKMMHEAGITDPAQVAKVGDTEVDIQEGFNAGCGLVIGVTTGIYTREQLESLHPSYVIDNLSELLEIIKQQ